MAEIWHEFRKQMPVAVRWAYFDHAAVAPLSLPATRALADWADEVMRNGDANWSEWRKRVGPVRDSAARLLGCQSSEVAFVSNTTSGLSIIAEAFPWQPGDNVVLASSEFPANRNSWRCLIPRGVEVRIVESESGTDVCEIDQLLAATDARTRIVTVSWIGFMSGWRHDLDALAEACHRRGILLCVDAIQGLGVIPLDLSRTPVDFLAADGHKWMLGPEGAGVLFIRQEHLERLRPTGIGPNSVAFSGSYLGDLTDYTFDCADTASPYRVARPLQPQEMWPAARRFEGGTANAGGILALGASLDLLLSFGIDAIWSRLNEVNEQLRQLLKSSGFTVRSSELASRRSGIVSCEVSDDERKRIQSSARAGGVILNFREGLMRFSPHAYTNDDDLERLRSVLTKSEI
ncbi:MAG: aminotransferase class V-fold PLP-dependent enzyme [Planctomycetaceae bacterium]|nr:aminotransferase class V-fold PLP-dependent enzyme [Planctomycetaceae bacterium]